MFKTKHRTLLAFLSSFRVEVCINLTKEGVIFPKREGDTTTVSLSTRFEGDLIIFKDKVIAELSFNGEKFLCTIPYDAIWSIRPLANKNAEDEPCQEELNELTEIYEESFPLSILMKYGNGDNEKPQ